MAPQDWEVWRSRAGKLGDVPKGAATVTLDGDVLDAVRVEAARSGRSEEQVVEAAVLMNGALLGHPRSTDITDELNEAPHSREPRPPLFDANRQC
jgi:plasmid stability protein